MLDMAILWRRDCGNSVTGRDQEDKEEEGMEEEQSILFVEEGALRVEDPLR